MNKTQEVLHTLHDKSQRRLRRNRLFSYAKREKALLLRSLFLTFLAVISDLIAPFLIARILDDEIIDGIGIRTVPVFSLLLLIYFLASNFSAFIRYKADLSSQNAASQISAHIRNDVFKHVQRMPISYFDNLPAGKVVSRITNDTKTLQTLYSLILSNLSMAASYIVFVYFSLLVLDWRLAFLMLLPMSALFLIIIDFRRKANRYGANFRRSLSELNANINENITNIELVQALGAEQSVCRRFTEIIKKHYGHAQDITKLFSYSAYNAVGTLRYLTIASTLLIVAHGSIKGYKLMTPGMLFLFVDYASKIFAKSIDFSMHLGNLERSKAAADHVFELLALETENETEGFRGSKINVENIASGETLIEFDQVSFSYVEGTEVLNNISFSVNKGETLAIVGSTGSGKSTIMNLLLRFYDVNSGSIRIAGHDLRNLNRQDVRETIAIVQQDCFLFTGTVLDNISLNKKNINPSIALSALKEVGGQFFLDSHSEGLKTAVIQNGATFSSGEKQLITFARALAQNPSILILDEASSHVDTETEQIIQSGTLRLMQGRTTIIIAHRLSTIKHAQHILVLEQGRVVEYGNHQELIEKEGSYCRMIKRQSIFENN